MRDAVDFVAMLEPAARCGICYHARMLYDPGEDDCGDFILHEDAPGREIRGYRELKIHTLAHAFGVATHRLSMDLPKFELYESGSQLRRAAKSVSANIVEGYGRRVYKAEFLRFLVYAKSSLDEAEEHLSYVGDCYPELKARADALLEEAANLGHRMHRFIKAVKAAHRT